MFDRRSFLLAGAASGALAPLLARAASADPAGALDALLASFAQADLVRSPQEATSLGLDVGALAPQRSRLAASSLAAFARDKADIAERVARLKTIDRAALGGMAAVNYDTVAYVYEGEAEANRLFDYGGTGAGRPYVISQLTGVYQSVPDFLDTHHPIETPADAEAYLDRLGAFASVMDHEREVARHDAALGTIPPDFILERTLGQMRKLAGTPADSSILVASLARRAALKNIPGDWRARAAAIYEKTVLPAVGRQIELVDGWRAGASRDAGVWRLK
ncbi:MAG: DUF885 family protein, partial [Caulobacteraceae bacterium]